MAIAIVLLIIVLATPAAFAAQHIVGGNSGWTNFGTDYSTWASGETFNVGDTIVFNYDSTNHKVTQVSQSDYNSCSSSNAIKTYNDGATTITLSKAGPMYFICPTPGHCGVGMKLAVNVLAASTTPSPTPSGTSPSTPSPTTPGNSPSTPTTPATPTGSPSTPASGTSPTTPSTSVPSAGNKSGATGVSTDKMMTSLMLGSLLLLGTTVALMG